MRRTKIICTIGPACDNAEVLGKMLHNMDIARLNFSHGTHDVHSQYIRELRKAAKQTGKCPAILLDIKGPEIRLGTLEHEPVQLAPGQTVILAGDCNCTSPRVGGKSGGESLLRLPVSFKNMAKAVHAGDKILIADGLVSLTVEEIRDYDIYCRVIDGGKLYSGKGINVPGVETGVASLTEKDERDIRFGIEQGVDYVAASFVRSAADVITVRKVIEKAGGFQEVIAKIECSKAMENMENIIRASDGVMVARGDLGVEIPPEDVPIIQKRIIQECNELGKPVITATQMLESMIHNPRPTRAEASDIANAILDGTDAVMLSGETAIGKYPVESVNTMARIARRADEAFLNEWPMGRVLKKSMHTVTDSIGRSTCTISYNLNAAAIITSTQTGYTAKMVARYRPPAPIVAVTPNRNVLRRLALVWGVQAFLVPRTDDTDSMIESAVKASLEGGVIKPGDLVILTAGVPVGVHGTTNLLKIQTVGDILIRGTGTGNRSAAGRVKIAMSAEEALDKIEDDDVLVAPFTDRDYIPAIKKAAAIITVEGGLTSHAAVVGLEFRIPVVVNVKDAFDVLKDDQIVTVDSQRGLIYTGKARVF